MVRGAMSDVHYWCVPGVVVWTVGSLLAGVSFVVQSALILPMYAY